MITEIAEDFVTAERKGGEGGFASWGGKGGEILLRKRQRGITFPTCVEDEGGAFNFRYVFMGGSSRGIFFFFFCESDGRIFLFRLVGRCVEVPKYVNGRRGERCVFFVVKYVGSSSKSS